MILRKLRVQNFRCFRNPVELSGLGTGVHVIHAPNESGKSSLVLAVARALFDHHSTQDREIQQLRPWKTDLSPRITLEFETGGRRFQLEKAFLDEATSLLDEWTGTRFERLAESRHADELVRGFLISSVPGRGATKVGNWGLARLLWLNQIPERHEFPGLDPALKGRLLETVGVAALSAEEQALLKAVDAVYSQYYTPKTRKPIAGSELVQQEERIRVLEGEVARLIQRREETARNADAITDTVHQLAAMTEEKASYVQQLASLQERIEAETRLEQTISLRQKDVERQQQTWKELDQKQRDLLELQRKVAKHEALAAQKQPAIQEAQAELRTAEARQGEARERLKAQQEEYEKADQRLERGRLVEKSLAVLEEQHRLEGRIKQGVRLETAFQNSLRKTTALKGLSESDVKRTEDVERKLTQAQARMAAQGIDVRFTAESSQNLEWEAQGHARKYKVAKDEQKRFEGVTSGELRIKGVGLLSVRTEADELGKLQAEVDKHRKELARRLHEQGAQDLAGLKAVWEDQRALFQEHQKHDGALKTFLETAGFTGIDALREKQRELAGELGALAAQLELPVEELGTYTFPEAGALAEEVKVRKREVKLREKARDEAEAGARKADQHLRALTQERSSALQQAETLSLEVQSQLGALGGSLEQLGADVERAAAELRRQENMVKGMQSELPRPEARAAAQRRQLQQAMERVEEEGKTAKEKIIRAETLIGQAVADDLYAQLCKAEEALALEQARHQQGQTRARAAEALRALATDWQEQVSRSFVGPIEEEIHARLDYIRGGSRPGRLMLDPDFGDAQMQTAAGPKPLDSFSWGTQEQTLFALRLAIGGLLSTKGPRPEPQLVVLDDALVNTDAIRHRRALELIENAGDTLQVLILTAFPERYRTLRGMKSFDLKALDQGAPAGP